MIARGSQDEAEVVAGRGLATTGASGFGEAAPIERYDESAAVGARLARAAGRRSGTIRSRSSEIAAALPPGEQAARAAVDAALHDLLRQARRVAGLAAARAASAQGPPTSWTVWLGDPDDMARRAEQAAAARRSGG